MKTVKILVGLFIIVANQPTTAQTRFPAVSRAEQQDRDRDRRAILLAELKNEQVAFAKAKTEYANQPDDTKAGIVRRHGRNINALWRELKNTARDQHLPKGHDRLSTTEQSTAVPSQRDASDAALTAIPLEKRKKGSAPWVNFVDGAAAIPYRSPARNEVTPPFVQMIDD
jgi:hypothetical protein